MDKVCILIPSFGTGGAEKVGVNLANYYASKGLDVDLVALSAMGGYRGIVTSSVNIVDIDAKRARYSILPLRRYFAASRPRVVLSVLRGTNVYAALACLALRNAPALHFREASPVRDLAMERSFWAALFLRLMWFTYKRADSIISNSDLTRDDLVAHGIIEENKSTVIHNPVLPQDYAALAEEETRHPWLNDSELNVVLSVGRLYPEKNQRLLVQAFRIVAKHEETARLLILGEGPEKRNLQEQISGCGMEDRVELHDFVQNPFPYYSKAKVFVLTSKFEGFGNVIVEALSTGTPVVCTDCPGGPRTILADGKYGRLVQQDNEVQIAEAILETLSEKTDGGLLQQRAKEFSVANIGRKYAEAMGLKWKIE